MPEQKRVAQPAELAGLLSRLSVALGNQAAAKQLLAESERAVVELRKQIDKTHPLLRTIYGAPGNAVHAVTLNRNGKPRVMREGIHRVARVLWEQPLLDYLKDVPQPVPTQTVQDKFGISQHAASHRLCILAKEGKIRKIGSGRGSRFAL